MVKTSIIYQKTKKSNENIYDDVNDIYEFDKSELEFSLIDIVSSITIFKPFVKIFKSSGLLKNRKNYIKLKQLLSDDILL